MKVDASGLDAFLRRVEAAPRAAGERAMERLGTEAVADARSLLDLQIYSTPERGGYERTQRLLNSVGARVEPTPRGFRLILEADPARAPYASYNELGTYDYGLSPDDVLEVARRDTRDLIHLEFGIVDGMKGLEPRPFVLSAIVGTERKLLPVLAEELAKVI